MFIDVTHLVVSILQSRLRFVLLYIRPPHVLEGYVCRDIVDRWKYVRNVYRHHRMHLLFFYYLLNIWGLLAD